MTPKAQIETLQQGLVEIELECLSQALSSSHRGDIYTAKIFENLAKMARVSLHREGAEAR